MVVDKLKKAVLVRKELEDFNELFVGLLKKHVFDQFIQKLEECCAQDENEESRQKGPVLLKLCGSLTDVRLMLETACDEIGFECVFAEEKLDPLSLLSRINDSYQTHLIYIQDNASLGYLNRLLETFYTSKNPVFAVIAVRSNDSHVIRLNPNLAALVPIECTAFDDPEPLLEKMMNDLVLNFTRKSGLFLSGGLLSKLKESFIVEKQSFVELQNIIGIAISKYGMTYDLGKQADRQHKLLPDFERYWLLLELFFKFLGNGFSLDDDVDSSNILDIHTEIQLDEEWYSKAFEKSKTVWKGASKAAFEQLINSYIEFATEFKEKCANQRKLKEVLSKLEEIKELLGKSDILSLEQQRKKQLEVSPSRRKILGADPTVAKVLNSLNELFCELKPITTNSIPYALTTVECKDDDGVIITGEAENLMNKTVFF